MANGRARPSQEPEADRDALQFEICEASDAADSRVYREKFRG
jgi:hypothetical protein